MVAGPETARLLTECEEKRKNKESERHHELPSVQKTFLVTKTVTDVIEELGSQTFVVERLNSNTAAFNDTVHKNNLPLLTSKSGNKPTNSISKICNLQNDVHLFSRMYISCQTRDSENAFFEHENHANGITHQTSKSDLMECWESVVPKSESVPDADVNIVDGAALPRILDPKKSHKSLSKLSMTMHSSCSCHI